MIKVNKDGYVHFTDAENQSGVLVYKVRITVVAPEDAHKPYAIKLQVHACVEGSLLFTVLSPSLFFSFVKFNVIIIV